MRGEPSCPRCGDRVRAPGLFADSWQCGRHGPVHPLQPAVPPGVEGLSVVVGRSRVPVWMPWPLPVGWLFTGVVGAGDDRSGGRASAVAVTGPGREDGPAEVLIVAEEPGVGLGARYAGLGPSARAGEPSAGGSVTGIHAAGRAASVHRLPGAPADRAVYAGRAGGQWLWVVVRPGLPGTFPCRELVLTDLRDAGTEGASLPCGPLSPRLLARPLPGPGGPPER